MAREPKVLTADFDIPFKSLTSGIRVDLGSKRTLKLKHRHPTNAASVEAAIPGWAFNYDFLTKEAIVEHKRAVRFGSLSIKQRIPYKQLFLVPSPEIKLACKPAFLFNNKLRAETTMSYDYLKSVGKVEQLLASKSKYKAVLTADTLTKAQGASLELSANLANKRLSRVAVDLSRARGPVLRAEGSLLSGSNTTKYRVDGRVKTRDVRLEVQPPAYNKLRLVLTSVVQADKPLATTPSLLVGATCEV